MRKLAVLAVIAVVASWPGAGSFVLNVAVLVVNAVVASWPGADLFVPNAAAMHLEQADTDVVDVVAAAAVDNGVDIVVDVELRSCYGCRRLDQCWSSEVGELLR